MDGSPFVPQRRLRSFPGGPPSYAYPVKSPMRRMRPHPRQATRRARVVFDLRDLFRGISTSESSPAGRDSRNTSGSAPDGFFGLDPAQCESRIPVRVPPLAIFCWKSVHRVVECSSWNRRTHNHASSSGTVPPRRSTPDKRNAVGRKCSCSLPDVVGTDVLAGTGELEARREGRPFLHAGRQVPPPANNCGTDFPATA